MRLKQNNNGQCAVKAVCVSAADAAPIISKYNQRHTLQYHTVHLQGKQKEQPKQRSTICTHGIPLGIKSFEGLFEPSCSLLAACQRQKCRAPNQIGHERWSSTSWDDWFALIGQKSAMGSSPKHAPGASFLGGPAPKFRSSLRSSLRAESVSSQRSDVQVGPSRRWCLCRLLSEGMHRDKVW